MNMDLYSLGITRTTDAKTIDQTFLSLRIFSCVETFTEYAATTVIPAQAGMTVVAMTEMCFGAISFIENS